LTREVNRDNTTQVEHQGKWRGVGEKHEEGGVRVMKHSCSLTFEELVENVVMNEVNGS